MLGRAYSGQMNGFGSTKGAACVVSVGDIMSSSTGVSSGVGS